MKGPIPPESGHASLALCTVLLGSALLLSLQLQRWVVDRQRMMADTWPKLQAQSVGHGALMWTLAQLVDPRPLNDRCEAVAPRGNEQNRSSADPPPDSFEARLAQPGRRLRCQVLLNSGGADEPWRCDCSGQATPDEESAPGQASRLSPNSSEGIWELDFKAEGEGLRATIRATVNTGLGPQGQWSESVRIRRDHQQLWRPVVGTWMDGR